MADGKTKSAAKFYTRVDIDRCKSTENFSVRNKCIGCEHCATICPAQAIKMEDGHPTWVKPKCFMCFGCLRLCPCGAIRYGQDEEIQSTKDVARAS